MLQVKLNTQSPQSVFSIWMGYSQAKETVKLTVGIRLQDGFEQKAQLLGLKQTRDWVCAHSLSCILIFSVGIFLLLCFDHSD